jgi:hypothetical protein
MRLSNFEDSNSCHMFTSSQGLHVLSLCAEKMLFLRQRILDYDVKLLFLSCFSSKIYKCGLVSHTLLILKCQLIFKLKEALNCQIWKMMIADTSLLPHKN